MSGKCSDRGGPASAQPTNGNALQLPSATPPTIALNADAQAATPAPMAEQLKSVLAGFGGNAATTQDTNRAD